MELIIGFILLFVVLIAFLSKRFNMPIIIIALLTGIFFGGDITGLIKFHDTQLTKNIANIALIFILFAGGFGTKSSDLKPIVVRTSVILATIGVLLTAGITGIIIYFLTDWGIYSSLLLGAIISSTDAAAVFSILRSRAINKNVSSITEVESAANDPMAILFTTFLISIIIGTSISTTNSILLVFWQLLIGIFLGIILGKIFVYFFDRIRTIDIGYYYLFLIGGVFFAYGVANILNSSGMIAVFFMGLIMGEKKLPFKRGITSFVETLAFISNVGLFILLGLLVSPKELPHVWFLGILVFLVITFISRPISVFICTMYSKLNFKEKIFLSWGGLRGAVPIVLATFPIIAGIENSNDMFNIVFIAVSLSIIIQGTTVGKLADILKISSKPKFKNVQTMELVTILETNYELIEINIDKEKYFKECKISEFKLGNDVTITMINRNDKIIPATGATLIKPGDTIFLLVEYDKVLEITQKILEKFIDEKKTDSSN